MLKVLKIKTITKFQPHYFSRRIPAITTSSEADISYTSIDLGHCFWNTVYDEDQLLKRYLSFKSKNLTSANQFNDQADKHALSRLKDAKEILASAEENCPDGQDLWFCFRVMSGCLAIFNREQQSFSAHLARGYLPSYFNYYSLEDTLRVIESSEDTESFPSGLLKNYSSVINKPFDIAIFTPRNDLDFCQILSLCKALKGHNPKIKTILSAAGANEQLDFGAWIKPLIERRLSIRKYLDYFVPREDYGLAVAQLISRLQFADSDSVGVLENVVDFGSVTTGEKSEKAYDWKSGKTSASYQDQIDTAFLAHNKNQSIFLSNGLRSIVMRLSNERCHWAACDFCTINSQHLMRNGNRRIDYRIEFYVDQAIANLQAKQIQSVIFTDEALHPDVLRLLASSLISSGVNIVYRARARFTEAFYSKEFCGLLGKSGLKYLGCGLESASSRINKLVNKNASGELDYDLILQNLEEAGIRPHIYSIMNFPTETLSEINLTRDFLVNAIEKYDYVTVSPNLFYLMEGSRILSNLSKYAIEFIEKRGELALTVSFNEVEALRNQAYARQSVVDIHAAQFQTDIQLKDDAERFWYFIDQSGIFYQQKVAFKVSPYKNMNSTTLSIIEFRSLHISLRYSFSFLKNESSFVIIDWITLNYCEVSIQVYDTIQGWDENLTVDENLNEDHRYLNVIYELFQLHCFRVKHSKNTTHSTNNQDRYATQY